MLGAVGGIVGADVEAAAMLESLRRQERSLSTVAATMAVQAMRMPSAAGIGWRGPAHSAYGTAADRLIDSIERAADAVTAALRDTRTAIVVLETRSS